MYGDRSLLIEAEVEAVVRYGCLPAGEKSGIACGGIGDLKVDDTQTIRGEEV